MSLQYRRVCQILIGAQRAGVGVTVNQDFRIKFTIEKTIRHTPNQAVIQIYNLSPDTEGRIKNEFDEVKINAGYQDSQRLIFAGNIRRVWRYRDGNEQITEIRAADGDDDYRNTIVNAVFSAGTSDRQVLSHIASKFKTTQLGDMTVISDEPRIRAKVISGLGRHEFSRVADSTDVHWSTQDGVIQFVPFAGTLPTEAIVIRADTGMLKAPEISDKGIKVWCLLNPAIKCGGKIKLDNNDLKEKARKDREKKAGAKKTKPKSLVRLDPDGIYRVNKIVHRGDTRDKEWTTETLCTALGSPIPADKEPAASE